MERTQDSLAILDDGECLRAALAGEIDHHAARPIREALDAALFRVRPHEMVLDFTRVHFMDSSGIALIMGRAEIARKMGCRVTVRGLSYAQERLVRLSGIERLEGVTVERWEVKK